MILASKKFQKYIEIQPSQKVLADKMGIDEIAMSNIVNNKREATKSQIEAILQYTGWPFEELFDIDEPARRKEDK